MKRGEGGKTVTFFICLIYRIKIKWSSKVDLLLVLGIVTHPFPYALRSAENSIDIYVPGKYRKMMLGSVMSLGSAFIFLL